MGALCFRLRLQAMAVPGRIPQLMMAEIGGQQSRQVGTSMWPHEAGAQQTWRVGIWARPECSEFPPVPRFPILMKNLRFLPLIIKVPCLKLRIQAREKV